MPFMETSPAISPVSAARRLLTPTFALALAALLLHAAAGASSASGAAAPPAPTVSAQVFQPTGEYVLRVDNQPAPEAKLYVAEKGDAYLVLSSRLAAPVLLDVPSKRVSTLGAAPAARADGSLVVGAATALTPQGSFQVEGEAPAFTVAGVHARLEPAPPLLGEQTAAALRRHDPGYGRRAAAYQPDAAALGRLAAASGPVRLRVYFGSWCPICAQSVPRLLKVIDSLKQPPYVVEFYGLPQDREADPEPKRMDLHSLPTAIVYRQGREVGRITGDQWRQPEVALRTVLGL